MICVGIDVAKDKHDCFILSSEGEVLADVFTISNNAEGFLFCVLQAFSPQENPLAEGRRNERETSAFSRCLSFMARGNNPNPLRSVELSCIQICNFS